MIYNLSVKQRQIIIKVSARQTETDGRQQLLQDKDRETISP